MRNPAARLQIQTARPFQLYLMIFTRAHTREHSTSIDRAILDPSGMLITEDFSIDKRSIGILLGDRVSKISEMLPYVAPTIAQINKHATSPRFSPWKLKMISQEIPSNVGGCEICGQSVTKTPE